MALAGVPRGERKRTQSVHQEPVETATTIRQELLPNDVCLSHLVLGLKASGYAAGEVVEGSVAAFIDAFPVF